MSREPHPPSKALGPNASGLPPTWEIRLCEDQSLDEVVGLGFFHLEKMDDDHWWMALYEHDSVHSEHPRGLTGRRININLWRVGTEVVGTAELEE